MRLSTLAAALIVVGASVIACSGTSNTGIDPAPGATSGGPELGTEPDPGTSSGSSGTSGTSGTSPDAGKDASCVAQCGDHDCGPDNCGGSCGTCAANEACS